MTSGLNKPGKRKRSISELEDIENCGGPSWSCDRSEHQRKRLRDSPGPSSPPLTPLHPLSPNNQCHTPESSPRRRRSTDSTGSQRGLETLSWLNRSGLSDMLAKHEMQSNICDDYFIRHPTLQPRMRAVLMDWLMEVCDAYKMHRETYYLAVNYLDRYLSKATNVAKTQLQLIGVTCLFIASKVEEIYPPKVHELAYVTNEACTTDGILSQELVILDKLEWNMGALTVHAWLSLFLQLCHNREATPKSIIIPNHPVKDYLISAQLLDLCMLDEGCLKFPYLAVAAAAIYVITDYKDVIFSPSLTEKNREAIFECVRWMTPFADAIREKTSPSKNTTVNYSIQSHHGDLQLLETVQQRLKNLQYSSVAMTPPPSNEKPPSNSENPSMA